MRVKITKGKYAGREGTAIRSTNNYVAVQLDGKDGTPDPEEIIEVAWDAIKIITVVIKFIKRIISLFKKKKK